MEHQLIEHHTAVLAKEKGFDIPCENYWVHWHHNEKMRITRGIDYDSDLYIEFDWNNNSEDSKMIQAPYPNKYHKSQASAPTQAQLHKWLREKHYIVVEIQFDTVSFGYRVFNPYKPQSDFTPWRWEMWEYEEALENGLQEALKLIKD